MNFWARQTAAKQRGKFLFVAFFVALIFCALIPYALIYSGIAFFQYFPEQDVRQLHAMLWDGFRVWKHPTFYISALIIGLPILGGALIQQIRLARDSGKVVAEMLNGTLLPPSAHGFYQRRLYNIVKEMSIASGVPIPRIYLLDDEAGINSLVAGRNSHAAVLCVTRGACELLKRDELQGIIAHEFSHLLNGDMAFHTTMLETMHGFFLSIKTSKKLDISEGGSGYLFRDILFMVVQIMALVLLLPLWLWLYGMIFGAVGKMIKSAFARSREYLADACAVQFTRYPQGLADAMKKVGSLPRWQVIRRSSSVELSHFFFTDGTPPPLMFNLFPSHPPLKKRIKLLDNSFNGIFPEVDRKKLKKELRELKDHMKGADDIVAGGIIMDCDIPRQLRIDALVNRFGSFNSNDIEQSAKILRMIPKNLIALTQSYPTAMGLIYALLTDRENKKVAQAQVELLQENCIDEILQAHQTAIRLLHEHDYFHMILVELCIPALREISPKEYDAFRTNCRGLVLMDNKLTMLEYSLTTAVSVILDPFFGLTEKEDVQVATIEQQVNGFGLMLSMLAWGGADDETTAQGAFEEGRKVLPWPNLRLEFQSLQPFEPDKITQAVLQLSRQFPQRKKHIINACLTTIGADMVIKPVEWDILRAFAMMLDCPLPLLPPGFKI